MKINVSIGQKTIVPYNYIVLVDIFRLSKIFINTNFKKPLYFSLKRWKFLKKLLKELLEWKKNTKEISMNVLT